MGIIAFLVLGGIAGWIASLLMRTDASQGIFLNVVAGVVGALVGGITMNLIGAAGVTGFNIYSLAVAVVGSVILLWIVKMARA